jgi:hypothetical protein
MTVICVDDNPAAVNDAATVLEDAAATAINVLTNDTDPDGGPKLIASVTQPANGAVIITGGGSGLTYQPNANYCNAPPGTTLDTFTYTLTPGGSIATVTVTVTCVNDPVVVGAVALTGAAQRGSAELAATEQSARIDAQRELPRLLARRDRAIVGRRSFAREQERGFASDAAAAARDERNLLLESHEYDPLSAC